jgi:hypothetical protein
MGIVLDPSALLSANIWVTAGLLLSRDMRIISVSLTGTGCPQIMKPTDRLLYEIIEHTQNQTAEMSG